MFSGKIVSTFSLFKRSVIIITFVDCNANLITVASFNSKLGFSHADVRKSSVRMSSTRFSEPVDNSINVPLVKFDDRSLSVLMVLIVGTLSRTPFDIDLFWKKNQLKSLSLKSLHQYSFEMRPASNTYFVPALLGLFGCGIDLFACFVAGNSLSYGRVKMRCFNEPSLPDGILKSTALPCASFSLASVRYMWLVCSNDVG